MKTASVRDPAGVTWRVEVRWLPWLPRWRGPRRDRKKDPADTRWYDWLDIGEPFAWFDEGLGAFVTAIVLAVLLVIAALFILPVFVFLIEVLIVGLVVLLAFGLRVLFRRPWLVDAFDVEEPSRHFTWKVVGLGASKRAVDEVAKQLSEGVEVPQVDGGELAKQPTHGPSLPT